VEVSQGSHKDAVVVYIHSSMVRLKAAVAGANGYAGMTLVNLLARHPGVVLTQLTSRSYAGQPYTAVFPLLEADGTFLAEPQLDDVDVVFSCLPHNVGAARTGEWLEAGMRVIDLSADFRLHDAAAYPRWYRQEHPAPALLAEAVYGLTELHAEEMAKARLIAVPGCYSSTSILALAPAVAAGVIASDVVIDAKSGVSGAGRSVGLGTHFSEVSESVHAYAVAGHRHLAELEQELGALAPGRRPRLTFVPHLVPMIRGIEVSCYFDATIPVAEVREAYRSFYAGQPFTRVVDFIPQTKLVSHSNHCLISISAQGEKIVVSAVLDNLVKGAAGQAVECFNLAFDRDRCEGLESPLQWP
jgi:N-acetyl-gamma-glutamyl-phosphate reductase